MTNWQEGDPLTPTNLNTRVPSWVTASSSTSAIAATTIANIISPVINVKTDYGAVGDGITDDYTAVQNALNAVTGTAGTTCVVYFPPGSYLNNTKPWIAQKSSTVLLGPRQGFGTTFARVAPAELVKGTAWQDGPVLFVHSSTAGTISGLSAPLVGSTGFSWADADNRKNWNLRESANYLFNAIGTAL